MTDVASNESESLKVIVETDSITISGACDDFSKEFSKAVAEMAVYLINFLGQRDEENIKARLTQEDVDRRIVLKLEHDAHIRYLRLKLESEALEAEVEEEEEEEEEMITNF